MGHSVIVERPVKSSGGGRALLNLGLRWRLMGGGVISPSWDISELRLVEGSGSEQVMGLIGMYPSLSLLLAATLGEDMGT